MLAQVAGGLGITCVEVTPDHTAITLTFAVLSVAFEDMDPTFLNVFNQRGGLEENIDR